MKKIKFLFILILCCICLMSVKRVQKQQFIQIMYTGISESSPRILFLTSQPVDTTTITERLNSLKFEITPQQLIDNNMSISQVKMLFWNGLFHVVVTNEKTFQETANFILKNKEYYKAKHKSDFTVTVNGTPYLLGIEREDMFFRRLVNYLTSRNCDSLVIKKIKRYDPVQPGW